jgi:trehalose 6-phosphate phosphatase
MAPMPRAATDLPDALADEELRARLGARPLSLFLDYDGTLTPIVARPELAVLDPAVRALLERLGERLVVGVLSGRDLDDVRALVGVPRLWYAGSHGYDIVGPDGVAIEADVVVDVHDALATAADALDAALTDVPGVWVERKRYADALHFRQAPDRAIPEIEAAVDRVVATQPGLRKTGGKRVFELRPDVDWDKGTALWRLFEIAGLRRGADLALFIGDDLTDEDAFRALGDDGVGIVVADDPRPTDATYRLEDPDRVRDFLELLAELVAPERP